MKQVESKTTTDHNEIKKWVEDRKGKPARVKGTEDNQNDTRLLKINFPGYEEESLENISWDEFFNKFEENNLAFLYEEKTADGKVSKFFKLIVRSNVGEAESKAGAEA